MAYPYRHDSEVRLLSEHFGNPQARTLKGWEALGGYKALRKALGMDRRPTSSTRSRPRGCAAAAAPASPRG